MRKSPDPPVQEDTGNEQKLKKRSCVFFLMSSYLMLPEMLNKQAETGDIASI